MIAETKVRERLLALPLGTLCSFARAAGVVSVRQEIALKADSPKGALLHELVDFIGAEQLEVKWRRWQQEQKEHLEADVTCSIQKMLKDTDSSQEGEGSSSDDDCNANTAADTEKQADKEQPGDENEEEDTAQDGSTPKRRRRRRGRRRGRRSRARRIGMAQSGFDGFGAYGPYGEFFPYPQLPMLAPPLAMRPVIMSPRGECFSYAEDGSLMCYDMGSQGATAGSADAHDPYAATAEARA